MWLLLLAACSPKAAGLERAHHALADGDYRDAVARYDHVTLRWPDSPEAGSARLGAEAALLAEATARYAEGHMVAAVHALTELEARVGPSTATYRVQAAIGPEIGPTVRYVRLAEGPRSDDALLEMITAVLRNADTPAPVTDLATAWACDGRTGFPAYAACTAPPGNPAVPWWHVDRSCQLLEGLAPYCPESVASELRGLTDEAAARWGRPAAAPRPAGEGLVGGVGGLLGARGMGGTGGLGSRGSGGEGRGGTGGAPSAAAPSSVEAGLAVRAGDPIVLGALDRAEIDDVVAANLPMILDCYALGREVAPDIGGKVSVKVVVAADGTVPTAEVKGTTLGHEGVEACVVEQFRGMRFPPVKGGGIAIVSYPLLFGPE